MHEVQREDENGELVDIGNYCSDSCARTDPDYAGWDGCNELEFTTYCESCGVVLGRTDAQCDCQFPVVVNLIGWPSTEYCEHGNIVRFAVKGPFTVDGVGT